MTGAAPFTVLTVSTCENADNGHVNARTKIEICKSFFIVCGCN